MRTAIIIGASGLVGRECVYQLLEHKAYSRILVLVRKPLPLKHHKLHQLQVDFDQLQSYRSELVGMDVFCCIGTTIKKAGSQEAFRKVDFDYPVELAKIALQNGAEQFILISSMGAGAQSSVFYSRVKGELEQTLFSIGFVSVKVLRPSLLLGNRLEFRAGELVASKVMKVLGALFVGPLKQFKAIPVVTVAKAMVAIALNGQSGNLIYNNAQLFDLEEMQNKPNKPNNEA